VTWTAKRRARVSGGELAFVDAGDPQAPSVVLLPGHLTSSYLWRQVVPMLSPWMHVVAPDLLGRGDSSLDDDADLSLEGQARTIRELVDGLGIERFAAVGHAFGGGLAQRLAVDGGIEALVLVDTIAFDGWPPARIRELQSELHTADAARVETWMRGLFDLGMSRRERLTEDGLEEYLRPFRGAEGVRAFVRVVSAVDGRGLEDLEDRLAALEVAALVLFGEEDRLVDPGVAERLGDVLPMASVGLLPGCGHFLLEDAAETVAPLIFQWLRRQYLKVEHRHEEAGPVAVYLGRRPPGEGG
jgi:pimeloyl-ACP methyl ester carboxylesterase